MRAAVLANLATDDSAILLAQTVINPEYMLSSPITSPVMYPKALRQKKAARPIPSPLPHPDQHAQLVSGKPGRALCDPSLYSHAANAPRAKAGASPAVSHLQRISSMARAVSPTGWGVYRPGVSWTSTTLISPSAPACSSPCSPTADWSRSRAPGR